MPRVKQTKTKTSVGDRIIAGLGEFKHALEHNENLGRRFTVRTVRLDLEPGVWNAGKIIAIRNTLSTSQAVFAELIGVTVHAIRAWEQGQREPTKMARRLLDEMAMNPARWRKLLVNAVVRKPKTPAPTAA